MNKEQLAQALQEARDEYNSMSDQIEEDIIAAAHVGNQKLVNHLIEGGSDINYCDDIGRTALLESTSWGTSSSR